jgi:hypothetical protein
MDFYIHGPLLAIGSIPLKINVSRWCDAIHKRPGYYICTAWVPLADPLREFFPIDTISRLAVVDDFGTLVPVETLQ